MSGRSGRIHWCGTFHLFPASFLCAKYEKIANLPQSRNLRRSPGKCFDLPLPLKVKPNESITMPWTMPINLIASSALGSSFCVSTNVAKRVPALQLPINIENNINYEKASAGRGGGGRKLLGTIIHRIVKD